MNVNSHRTGTPLKFYCNALIKSANFNLRGFRFGAFSHYAPYASHRGSINRASRPFLINPTGTVFRRYLAHHSAAGDNI